jgi:hypothetical protein
MPGTAAKVFFTEVQMEMLEGIVASRTASVRLVQRAQIILLSYQKRNNELIGEVVGLNPQQVSVWRVLGLRNEGLEPRSSTSLLRRCGPQTDSWNSS